VITQRDNFFYLFAAMILLIVLGPMLASLLGDLGILIGEASLALALVVALGSLQSSRFSLWFGVGLVVAHVAGAAVRLVAGIGIASEIAQLSALAFLVLSAAVSIRQVFRRDRVDLNKVIGALCVYLLLGAIFSLLYSLLDQWMPGSFSGFEQREGYAVTWRYFYLSFVTLTTLGYGDVLPMNEYAETLVVIEAVAGQFYLAVLVAGLLGAYLNEQSSRAASESSTSIGTRL
jgi:hypothetical protein